MNNGSIISRFHITTCFIFLLLSFNYKCFAQNGKQDQQDSTNIIAGIEKVNGFQIDSIPVYEVVNDDLANVLDSIIEDVELEERYTDSTEFVLWMYIKLGWQIVDISAMSDYFANSLHESENYIGCVVCSGHRFLIEARTRFSNLFKKTEKKEAYRFYYFYGYEYPTKDEMELTPIDDSHSRWAYLYEDGKFVDGGKLTFKKRPKLKSGN